MFAVKLIDTGYIQVLLALGALGALFGFVWIFVRPNAVKNLLDLQEREITAQHERIATLETEKSMRENAPRENEDPAVRARQQEIIDLQKQVAKHQSRLYSTAVALLVVTLIVALVAAFLGITTRSDVKTLLVIHGTETQHEIEALRADFDALRGEIAAVVAELAAIRTNDAAVQQQIAKAQADLTKLLAKPITVTQLIPPVGPTVRVTVMTTPTCTKKKC